MRPFRLKIGITSKLFLAILLTCIVVALAVSAAGSYSFSQGFLGYLNEQESQRVESLRPVLARAYQEHGSWDFLRDKPRTWFGLIRPPGLPPPPDAGNPPPPPGGSLPESELTGLNLRLALLDAEKRHVIGNPRLSQGAQLKPIEVDGAAVGWIAMVPFQQVTTGAAMQFQEQQRQASWVIAGLAVLLAVLVAYLLSRMFLAPVKRIAASTHRLAGGDYDSRVDVHSGDELGRLAEDFNRLAHTLQRNEQLRRAFMADVSHELRTPLAALKAELEAVEDGIRPLALSTVTSLQAQVATLGKLVNDLYELSLSDLGALSYRKVRTDMVEILELAVDAFGDRFAEKGIRMHLQLPAGGQAFCDADPDRMRQLLYNLLENSLRYTDAPGTLDVMLESDAAAVRLVFEDSAPGVPEHMLPQLFERFFRAEQSRSRATGGAGLGLAISRNIVHAHQGEIHAAASSRGGLRIEVVLPRTEGIYP
jgi:two-component system sensor histidine kinase BaeS